MHLDPAFGLQTGTVVAFGLVPHFDAVDVAKFYLELRLEMASVVALDHVTCSRGLWGYAHG